MRNRSFLITLVFIIFLTACEELPDRAVGLLTSDRIELVAETAESIEAIPVREGDQLIAGAEVLVQNSERLDIRIDEANANIRRLEAVLTEQLNGPRPEVIEAAQAVLQNAEIEYAFRIRERDRLNSLREQNLTSIESLELAQKLMDSAEVGVDQATARLNELENGTRPEQIEQTRQSLQQAQAQLASLELDRERHTVRTEVGGIVDSLPFEIGERPRVGDVVAVLLAGQQPHARIYVPEQYRVSLSPGDQVQVAVDGLDGLLAGTIRTIASEAAFTPYYALTENDRGRLSYIAEIELPVLTERLPDGVPVEAILSGLGQIDD